MEKRIILNGNETPFWIEDTGRLRNEKTKRWLKGGYNKGYHFYSLYFKGKQYVLYTHRAVAEYFVPNPNNLPVVHHIDGNKTNNFYLNLEWVSTQEHNTITASKQKGKPRKPRVKVTDEELKELNLAQFRDTRYYVSDEGKVYNMSGKFEMRLEESGNYLRFNCSYNDGQRKHVLVHRAVWEAFNGPIPEGYDIDHIDGNPKNNRLDNLEAVTHQENIKRRKMDWSYVSNNFYRGK